MPNYVTNNNILRSIRYLSSTIKGTRYQEGKEAEKKKTKNEKMKNDSRTNMHAFKEQAESGGDKVCSLCQTIWTRGLPTRDSSSIPGLVLDNSFP